MSDELAAMQRLNEHFLSEYPREAARALEAQSAQATLQVLLSQSPEAQPSFEPVSPSEACPASRAAWAGTTQQRTR